MFGYADVIRDLLVVQIYKNHTINRSNKWRMYDAG